MQPDTTVSADLIWDPTGSSELTLQEAIGREIFTTHNYCVKYLHAQSVCLWLTQSVRSPPSYLNHMNTPPLFSTDPFSIKKCCSLL